MKFKTLIIICIIAFFIPSQSRCWKIDVNFNKGKIGEKADNGRDGFDGAGGRSLYTKEKTLNKNAAKLQIKKNETGWGNWGGYITFPKSYRGETIWLLIHTYMPSNFDHHAYGEGNRLKFLRIHTSTSTGEHIGYNDLYFEMKNKKNPFAYIYEGEGKWTQIGTKKDSPAKEIWESYEFSITLDSVSVKNGGLARIKIWKNSVLLKDITDRITLKYSDAYADRALIFTYWNGGAPKDQFMYVDEIVITNQKPNYKDKDGNFYLKGLINNIRH